MTYLIFLSIGILLLLIYSVGSIVNGLGESDPARRASGIIKGSAGIVISLLILLTRG